VSIRRNELRPYNAAHFFRSAIHRAFSVVQRGSRTSERDDSDEHTSCAYMVIRAVKEGLIYSVRPEPVEGFLNEIKERFGGPVLSSPKGSMRTE